MLRCWSKVCLQKGTSDFRSSGSSTGCMLPSPRLPRRAWRSKPLRRMRRRSGMPWPREQRTSLALAKPSRSFRVSSTSPRSSMLPGGSILKQTYDAPWRNDCLLVSSAMKDSEQKAAAFQEESRLEREFRELAAGGAAQLRARDATEKDLRTRGAQLRASEEELQEALRRQQQELSMCELRIEAKRREDALRDLQMFLRI
mmetsp:Transcript_51734/g.168137  ORF Transcript_51734/g.168137 Transcript_51734/m.168137 type:complete len:200 (-) Transcript_51734:75-674(-)